MILYDQVTSLKGCYLVSSQSVQDSEFKRSVIWTWRASGGLVIGCKITELISHAHVIMQDEEMKPYILHDGGPDNVKFGHMIHTQDKIWNSSIKVTDSVYITPLEDTVDEFIQGSAPKKSFSVIGCKKWSYAQLEKEIVRGYWIPIQAPDSLIFDVAVVQRWNEGFRYAEIRVETLSATVGRS